VTRVLEHLDRAAKDAHGNRQTQLDLADAYTRLGNLQGNQYNQYLGNLEDGLISIEKALAIVRPLSKSNPRDRDAMQALALAENRAVRFYELWKTGRTAEAISAMQAAIMNFDSLIAEALAAKGIAVMKEMARKSQANPDILSA
jgi:tetratricopeptide (TPR) repeat protein